MLSCRKHRCRPKRTGDLLEFCDVLCNRIEVSSSEPNLDGSREQSRVNECMRFDGGERSLNGDAGTSSIALRQPKQGDARLRLTAELVGLSESLPGTIHVAKTKPHLADLVLGLAGQHHVIPAELLTGALRLTLRVGPGAAEIHDLSAVHPTDSGKAGDPLTLTPALRSVGPHGCPSPVGEIAADADRAAIDLSSRHRVQLSAEGGHRRLVDQCQTVVDATHGDQGISLQLQREGLNCRYGEPFANLLCQLCLTECFLRIAGHAVRKIAQRSCLPSMPRTFVRGLLEQPLSPTEPAVPDGRFQTLEVIDGKLQSHFGCVTFVALPQISTVRPLPCLDCRVGIPSEPCGLSQ